MFRAAIDKIANKYCFAGVVLEYALRFGIPKRDEQAAKRIGVAVHVTNYVIVLLRHSFFLKFISARTIVLALFASKERIFLYMVTRLLSKCGLGDRRK